MSATGPEPNDEPRRVLGDPHALAARIGAPLWDLTVINAGNPTSWLRRITLIADGLGAMDYTAGQDLMFAVPADVATTVWRRYTIRAIDRSSGELHLDVVVHGDGPGARWARTACVDDKIRAIGPRGNVIARPDADWHLFIGDESFRPAALAMAEQLEPASVAGVILEVPDTSHEDTTASVTWLARDGRRPGRPDALLGAARALSLPAGRGCVYLGGELHVVAAVRAALMDRDLAEDQIAAKPYWRRDRANAAHGEPGRD